MRVFVGHDPRTAIATNVASFSIWRRASQPVQITPLVLDQLPLGRQGLTQFTFSRFLVPHLCRYEGWALFVDSDILCLADIHEIMRHADPRYAVMAVDTDPVFERAAVMLFNCAHPDNAILSPAFIEQAEGLHGINWTENGGKLPNTWNFLADYDPQPYAIDQGDVIEVPHLIHYTKGIPVWPETRNCPFADLWHEERKVMCGVVPNWGDIMGASVHRPGQQYEASGPGAVVRIDAA